MYILLCDNIIEITCCVVVVGGVYVDVVKKQVVVVIVVVAVCSSSKAFKKNCVYNMPGQQRNKNERKKLIDLQSMHNTIDYKP